MALQQPAPSLRATTAGEGLALPALRLPPLSRSTPRRTRPTPDLLWRSGAGVVGPRAAATLRPPPALPPARGGRSVPAASGWSRSAETAPDAAANTPLPPREPMPA